jgi:general secretion pathway protein D
VVTLIMVLAAGCSLPEVRTAERLAAEGNWDGAVEAYRAAVKKAPFDQALQAGLTRAKARAAEQHYAEGRRHLQDNRLPEALHEFKLALGLDPSRSEHHAAMGDALRLKEARDQVQAADKLQSLGRYDEALQAYERAAELDPSLSQALEGITTLTQQQQAAKALVGSTQPITLRFQNARLKEVFEILARAGGINVLFDKDVKDDPITIFIKDTPFDEALNLILTTNGLFSRRVGPDTLLLIPNTKPKQDQYQDLMIRTFYLSNAKAKDMVNLIRTMLESKRVYVNEPLNALVIRDQPAKLQLAERIILANDRREAEVEFDLEVLEVNRTQSQKLGVDFAKSAGVGVVPPGFTGGVSATVTPFSYRQLTSLGPQSYLVTLPASVLLDFFKQESEAKTLASPKLRVLNSKQASVNIGDKQPILLSTTNVLPGQAATGAVPTTSTVTSIEFKDTGIKLTVEPTIHLVDELTLKIKIEVTRIGDLVTLQANPEIKMFRFGTRTAETTLNMKNEETVVLAGLIQDEERKTRVTVPGLGDIPILGQLFSTTTTETISTEVILTITPRIVRNVNTPGVESQAFWSGTESTYATSPIFTAMAGGPAVNPAALPRPATTAPFAQGAPQGSRDPAGGSPAPLTVVPPTPRGPSPALPPASAHPTPQAPPPLLARGAAVLALSPPALSAALGQEVRVDLMAEQLTGLTEAVLTVSFDSQALEFRRALEGAVLEQSGAPAALTVSAGPGTGQVSLRLRRQGPSPPSGGVLATLVFQTKTAGSFPVTIQSATVMGADGNPVPATVKPTVLQVR